MSWYVSCIIVSRLLSHVICFLIIRRISYVWCFHAKVLEREGESEGEREGR